jgi:hypothetical protein
MDPSLSLALLCKIAIVFEILVLESFIKPEAYLKNILTYHPHCYPVVSVH